MLILFDLFEDQASNAGDARVRSSIHVEEEVLIKDR